MLSLSAGARRLSDKEQAERTVTELGSSYERTLQEAKDKQNSLENLLCLWQKYEPSPNTYTSQMLRSTTINSKIMSLQLCDFTNHYVEMCFRYEKQRSNFASCLEKAESASKPDSQHLSADKVKLHTEIHDMQVCCLPSFASSLPPSETV